MMTSTVLRRIYHSHLRQPPPLSTHIRYTYTTKASSNSYSLQPENQNDKDNSNKEKSKGWFVVPPYTPSINGSALGKSISSPIFHVADKDRLGSSSSASETTALKWVLLCCPDFPRSLVHKLFRLRQVRRESVVDGDESKKTRLKRVRAQDALSVGERLFLPMIQRDSPSKKRKLCCTVEEVNFIRSLELYKDPAIIVVNKPPGMPVQGGIGITNSLDELAAMYLRHDQPEAPRLVHRLDRDCSGVLVMGRTQTSATVLHSIFREKTFAASSEDIGRKRRILERKYWALVIGSPRRSKGLISAPLGKVVVDNGKSDRITVVDDEQNSSVQHAVTQYRVLKPSSHGLTWLELSPLTGRKHQLRVHCAEVLGTPILGDYKYGWQAHRKWKQHLASDQTEHVSTPKLLPFGVDIESGSITEKHPRLHLHCKEMVLPDVSQALQNSSGYDFSRLESIELDAPLPLYMQRSWDISTR